MAVLASPPSAMHSLHLVVGIALCLCWLSLPGVDSSYTLSPREQQDIVDAHNQHRGEVIPPAANMQRMYWSEELANLAAARVEQCIYEPNYARHLHFKRHRYTGENIGVLMTDNIQDLIWYWFSEGKNYNYNRRACYPDNYYTYTCEHYLQLVNAKTCEVGCAIAHCPDVHSYSYYHHYLAHNGGHPGANNLLVICYYGPGYSEDYHTYLHKLRPYLIGPPCSRCPEQYSECDAPSRGAVGSQSTTAGLCYNRAEMCMGSDPHFAIRLSGGHLLCYTFQGIHNTTFNLVSNKQLQMNALFVPDYSNWDNTWLGSIGITVFHHGKKTTSIQFTAADQLITIGDRIQMEAKAIKKLSFHNGKLTMFEVPSNSTPRYPRVQVQFIDSNLNFTVGFAKNNHLDLYWHSTGVPYDESKGIVGQFFHYGVRVDEDSQLLHLPGRPAVPVEKKELWKFMEQSFHSDSECWASSYPSSQGVGIVAGSYKDYIVDGLLAVGQ